MPNEAPYIEAKGLEQPATQAVAIVAHASNAISHPTDRAATRGVYVGGAGNITCRFLGDTADVTLTGVLAGAVYPFRLTHVRDSSTASNMTGLY